MYTLEDVYKTFPSGCTEDYKILRAFEMGKQASEKRIAELEQENKVLAQNLEDTEIVNKALEKENAELKKLKRECETSLCRAEYQYNYEQLTKAKDHIKKLLDCLKQDTNDPQTNYYVCQYMDKAEQFIKDSEVKK